MLQPVLAEGKGMVSGLNIPVSHLLRDKDAHREATSQAVVTGAEADYAPSSEVGKRFLITPRAPSNGSNRGLFIPCAPATP
jgi:hypothetical protein